MPHGAWRSLVSALVWGTRGPEFKSRRPDQKSPAPGAFLLPSPGCVMLARIRPTLKRSGLTLGVSFTDASGTFGSTFGSGVITTLSSRAPETKSDDNPHR